MHQPPPISHQKFSSPGHSFPHFQRNRNFGPRGEARGRRGTPRARGYLHRAPQMEMYNNEHWCETCDRGFRSIDLLEQHKQQHEKCNIDGCDFIAHPKVITKHIQMQHSTGLFKKIANLKNPEDIEKWREERKKKYPTKDNVAKKAAEIKEKIERGEKMGLRQDKRKYGRNSKPDEAQKRKFSQIHENNDSNKKRKMTKQNEPNNNMKKSKNRAIPAAKEKRNLKPFGGIQGLIIESDPENEEPEQYSFLIEDDDAQASVPEIDLTLQTEEPTVCGALSSLMCEYGSSDDETEVKGKVKLIILQVPNITEKNTDQIHCITSSKNSQTNSNDEVNILNSENNQPTKEIKVDQKESDEDSGPEEFNIQKSVEKSTNHNTEKKAKPALVSAQKNKPNVQMKKCVIRRIKPKVPSTLIYKLLQKEIQQERNIVLQCIRHVVKNNYFDNEMTMHDVDDYVL